MAYSKERRGEVLAASDAGVGTREVGAYEVRHAPDQRLRRPKVG
jgi:hypothetical protein